jgi:hypothetical protein
VGLGAFSWITSLGSKNFFIFYFLFLILNTYQNSAVLISVGNPNLSQNSVVLILILIYIFFFLQEGILVTYHCQNDVVLIFPTTLTIILTERAKM